MKIVIRYLSLIAFIASAAWFYTDRGFEPAITSIASLVAFLSSFISSKIEDDDTLNISPEALELLNEIDSSEESKVKGISLMMIDSSVGSYRPFLWNDHIHGGFKTNVVDLSDIVSFVDQLEDFGYLIRYSSGRTIQQWRRTNKQP